MIESNPGELHTNNRQLVMESVKNYLSNILNSRRGCSESAPDFGIPDFVMIGGGDGPEGLRDFEKNLTLLIAKYEPRLVNPQVSHVGNEAITGRLEFILSGCLTVDGHESQAVFTTYIGGDGQIHVVA
jgi:type VI secretion system protein